MTEHLCWDQTTQIIVMDIKTILVVFVLHWASIRHAFIGLCSAADMSGFLSRIRGMNSTHTPFISLYVLMLHERSKHL